MNYLSGLGCTGLVFLAQAHVLLPTLYLTTVGQNYLRLIMTVAGCIFILLVEVPNSQVPGGAPTALYHSTDGGGLL